MQPILFPLGVIILWTACWPVALIRTQSFAESPFLSWLSDNIESDSLFITLMMAFLLLPALALAHVSYTLAFLLCS